ncbi:MAG: hypothetical protein U1E26_03810 [Coriobacteriia bacterium]|nr:hypothetical protein [Coriobacteriia bacterium]
MSQRIISRSTWVLFGSTIAFIALAAILVTLKVGGEAGIVAVSDIHETLVVGLAAAVILRAAVRLGPLGSVGKPWLLIGLGTFSYFVGDFIWTVIEVGMQQEVPYPGWPDVFYLLEYPFVAWGLLTAGLAFRGLVPLRRPATIAIVTGGGLAAIVYFALLKPFVLNEPGVSTAEMLFSSLYPLGDVLLMIAPAVFVLSVMASLGGGRLVWPWRAVAAGTVVIAITDVAYSWLSTYDLYSSGSVIDYGWGIGHALLMLGALIASDLATERS